jgi:mannose-1-phosphate guanylyltransferase/mannose-6-phosphate isomerase
VSVVRFRPWPPLKFACLSVLCFRDLVLILSVKVVILAGGHGSRLWPVSNLSRPKPFLPLVRGRSLLSCAIDRAIEIGDPSPWVVTSKAHAAMASGELHKKSKNSTLLLEPTPRDSAPAVAVAAFSIMESIGDEILLLSPADHYIPDSSLFRQTVENALPMVDHGRIIIFGVTPSVPSTAYGYIRRGKAGPGSLYEVSSFLEKPSLDVSQKLILEGECFWNAGLILARASTVIDAFASHSPDIFADARDASRHSVSYRDANGLNNVLLDEVSFSRCHPTSFDYAVLEKYSDLYVTPFAGQWADVGNWEAVSKFSEPDTLGNSIVGQGTLRQSKNTFIYSPDIFVAAIGVRDLAVVASADGVLVANWGSVGDIKSLDIPSNSAAPSEGISRSRVIRPWGFFDEVDSGEGYLVKSITVNPKSAISLQKHQHRCEKWVVCSGQGIVTLGAEKFSVSVGEQVNIPKGLIHRIKNNAIETPLVFVEVQFGDELVEEDIIRIQDDYGRVN